MEEANKTQKNILGYEYQALMAAMEVSVSKHLLDEHFTLIECNDYYYNIIRYPKEEYAARFHNRPDIYYSEHGYVDELVKISKVVLEAIGEGKSGYSVITRMPVRDGGHVWVRMTGTFTEEYVDGCRVSYTVITDINDLVQIQMEQSVTYNHIPGFVARCMIHSEDDIELLESNEKFQKFFGYKSGQDAAVRVPADILGCGRKELKSQIRAIMKGQTVRFAADLRNECGRKLRAQISGECVDWSGQMPIYLFVYIDVTDLTDLREMQKKLRKQARELKEALKGAEAASRAKSDFLSRMSHDIRTPMNAIVGMTEIAGAHLHEPDRLRDCLKKITVSSQHLLGLINDVLDMSKIESGQMQLRNEPMFLPEIMENIVTIVQPMIKGRRQNFSVRLHNLEHEYFICDSLRLHQCFINILSNASKFTPEGGRIAIDIAEIPQAREGYAELDFRFADTGIGIKEEFLPHIFDTFSRELDGRVDKTEGSGLGMAITKKIVDLMDGTITVQSRVGEGTVFTIHLPLRINEIKPLDIKLPPIKVLVVDDDETMCEYTVETLRECGADASWTGSGAEAIRLIKDANERCEDYDAVILDWRMPKPDGLDTVRHIRQEFHLDVPILIASAYDWNEIEKEAVDAGVNAFLQKPLFRSTLYNGLQKYVLGGSPGPVMRNREKRYDFTGKRLMIAEDNDLNLEIAVELLSGTGADIDTACNGAECVEKFINSKEGYYDLLLMDVQMPVMDGYTATKVIRKMDRRDALVPILAMTADAFAEDIADAFGAGMNGHLSKPLDIGAVKEEISKFV